MPSINTQQRVAEILKRKSWKQVQLLKDEKDSPITISRIMNRLHSPQVNTYSKMMDALEAPAETLFTPRFDNASPEMIHLYEGILFELDRASFHAPALENAKMWLEELRQTNNFNEGINYQLFLGCQLKMDVLENKCPIKIAKEALEGIYITYPEFTPEKYIGEILIAGEAQLMHVYACALAKTNPRKAINLLIQVIDGIENTPEDELTKESYLAPLLLDLAKMLATEGNHDEAVKACDKGTKISLKRNKGKHVPDFRFVQVQITHDIKWLLPIFCGYTLLGRNDDAKQVLLFSESLNHILITHGVEHLKYTMPPYSMERSSYAVCNQPGQYIWLFRTESDIKQSELADGICPTQTLNRIENEDDPLQGTLYQLEALMQRLGRYIHYYFDTHLSDDVFQDKQLRDEVNALAILKRFDEAEALLNKLEKKKAFIKGLGKQFVLSLKASIYQSKNGRDEKYFNYLMEAWKITKKNNKIDFATKEYLTKMEIVLLSKIANYYYESGEYNKGINLLEGLRRNLNFYYVDEMARMETYIMILYNITTMLGRSNLYIKSLEIIHEAENICLKFGNLRYAYQIAGNKGSALIGTDKKKEGIPFLIASYYTADLLGFEKSKTAAKKYAAEKMLDVPF